MMSTIDLSVGDYDVWDSTFPPREILQAELDWEGGDIAPTNSQGSTAPENVNELRDPYLFEDDDGMLYLFYCGRGEDAIGVALVCPVTFGDCDCDGDVDLPDFVVLAACWMNIGCGTCNGADLTGDGRVLLGDLRDFAANWLTGVE